MCGVSLTGLAELSDRAKPSEISKQQIQRKAQWVLWSIVAQPNLAPIGLDRSLEGRASAT